jgi:hypothetical protein
MASVVSELSFGCDALRLRRAGDVFDRGFEASRGFGEAEVAAGDEQCHRGFRFLGLLQVAVPGFDPAFQFLPALGREEGGAGFGVDFGEAVGGGEPRPRQRHQQVFVIGFATQLLFGPFRLFLEDLGGFGAAAVTDQVADVEGADDEEEAGAHQQCEDRVDDADDVLPASPDVEQHPSLPVLRQLESPLLG